MGSQPSVSGSSQSERLREFGQRRHQVVIFGEDLNRDMVGACKQVFVQPCRDRVWSAVGDHGVNQAVAARPGDFVVGEAQPFPVVQLLR